MLYPLSYEGNTFILPVPFSIVVAKSVATTRNLHL